MSCDQKAGVRARTPCAADLLGKSCDMEISVSEAIYDLKRKLVSIGFKDRVT